MNFLNFLLSVGNTSGLAAIVIASETWARVIPFPGAPKPMPALESLELSQEQWLQVLRQMDIQEVEVLARMGADGVLGKIVLRKSQRQIDQNMQWRIYRRDGYRCRYCGADDVPLTVDHLITWEEGGPSVPENMVAACRRCNKARGPLDYGPWLRSNRYHEISRRLTPETRAANEALLSALQSIELRIHVHSR